MPPQRNHFGPDMSSTVMSIIEGAADAQDPRRALERFIDQYGIPLREYLVTNCRLSEADAEETLHDFLIAKLMGSETRGNVARMYLKKVESAPNMRFRSYLLLSLRNFATDRHRSNKLRTVAISELDGFEPQDPQLQQELEQFDCRWAHNLLQQAIEQVRENYQTPDQMVFWRIFEARVLIPTFEGTPAVSYEQLCSELGLETPKQAANRLQTVIRKFRSVIAQLIVDYIPVQTSVTPEMINAELADLRHALGVPAHPPSASQTSQAAMQLLDIKESNDALWEQSEYPELWTHLTALPLKDFFRELDSEMAARLARVDGFSQQTATLIDLLSSPAPQMDLLEAIKRSTKRSTRAAQPGEALLANNNLPTVVNAVLYLSSIAAAWICYGVRLSSDPDRAFAPRLDRALKLSWLDPATKQLLQRWRQDL